jgi:RNA polymerase II subunit A small phosphatase-like protein
MGELAQAGEVYAPPPQPPPRSTQLWKTLLNWLALFFQIFLQIVRGTPQVLSSVGFGGPHRSFLSPDFRPLPVADSPEFQESPAASVEITAVTAVNGDGGIDYQEMKRLTVVLDLDETLVCAYEPSSLPATVRNQAIEAGLKWFELECISSDKECEGKPKINYVTVFERPGLREFLEQLSEFADLVLFTAGLEGYARPLVDRIDVENRFYRRLYRPSTSSTEYREHVKDLSCLSKDLCRTVIVDNNPFSFLLQPMNGIPCIPFSAGQPRDDQLLEVLLPLLRYLSQQNDVRPFLYEKFHMPEWFQKHGIPFPG